MPIGDFKQKYLGFIFTGTAKGRCYTTCLLPLPLIALMFAANGSIKLASKPLNLIPANPTPSRSFVDPVGH